MGGEQIGDAATEIEGDEDAEQPVAEPTRRALVTAAKSRVPGAPGQVGRPQLSKAAKKGTAQLSCFWAGAAHHHGLQVTERRRRHEKRTLLKVLSTVGNTVTKVRSRLHDDTVDALCFLKCYWVNQ